jgi:cation:H+ antiporter
LLKKGLEVGGGRDYGCAPQARNKRIEAMLVSILWLVLGLVVLVAGAEFLVKGSSRLAVAVGISPLVVGLTVVAFGTSAPELAVSVMSSWQGKADLALGNVVGSNIFNILVILGLAALVVPLVVAQQLVRFDVPVMIGISVLVLVMGMDGSIGRLDGALLFGGAVFYTTFLVRQSRRETSAAVKAQYEDEFGGSPEEVAKTPMAMNLFWIGLGMVGLLFGSKLLVDGAIKIAAHFGVSELIIGLTIVSAGTSLPEVAASVVAAVRGERDIAVGNAVGSNILNILSVLGLASLVSPSGITVPVSALVFDIPVMIAVAIACLPVFFDDYRISRLNGFTFLVFYVLYICYLWLYASQHDALAGYQTALVYGVGPVTLITLMVLVWRGMAARKSGRMG